MGWCYEYCKSGGSWCVNGLVGKPCADPPPAPGGCCCKDGAAAGASRQDSEAGAGLGSLFPNSNQAAAIASQVAAGGAEVSNERRSALLTQSFLSYFRARPWGGNSYQAISEPDDDIFDQKTGRVGSYEDTVVRVPAWSGNPALRVRR